MYTSIPLITKWVVIDKTKEDNILSSIIVDTMKTNISFLILFFSIISLQCFLIALYVPYDPIMNGFSGAEAGPAFTNLRWFYDMTGMLYIETDLPHGVQVLWKVYCYIIILISQNVESNCWGSREPEYSSSYSTELSSSLVYAFTI